MRLDVSPRIGMPMNHNSGLVEAVYFHRRHDCLIRLMYGIGVTNLCKTLLKQTERMEYIGTNGKP